MSKAPTAEVKQNFQSYCAIRTIVTTSFPRLNAKTGLLDPSTFKFKEESLSFLGSLVLKLYKFTGVIKVQDCQDKDGNMQESSNCTLINLALKLFGPMHEKNLTLLLLFFQVRECVNWLFRLSGVISNHFCQC